MAKFILSDQRTKKRTDPETLYIPDIPAPKKNPAVYFDAHPKAPTGFALKVTPAGSKKWILCYYVNGRERRMTLDKGYPAWRPQRARKEATDLKTLVISGADLLAEKEAEKAQLQAEKAAKADKASLTLGALLQAYVEQLRAQGKHSARAVEKSLEKNIKKAHREKWDAPADELAMEDFRDIVGTLTAAKKYREAQKVRAYMRAAYTAALAAHGDPMAVPELRRFNIRSNPVRDVAPVKPPKGAGRKKRKALTLAELRAYWKRISALPGPVGGILRLHLLTGGQRMEQLCRLTVDDIDGDVMTLYDPKGRRAEERQHNVPLLQEAQDAIAAIGAYPYVISVDGGETPMTAENLGQLVAEVSEAMLKAEETAERFTGEIIRSTVETRLAEAKVRPVDRAYLQSHGLGGIQARHYDEYDYMPDKRAALEILHGLLTKPSGDVVPMKRRAKK